MGMAQVVYTIVKCFQFVVKSRQGVRVTNVVRQRVPNIRSHHTECSLGCHLQASQQFVEVRWNRRRQRQVCDEGELVQAVEKKTQAYRPTTTLQFHNFSTQVKQPLIQCDIRTALQESDRCIKRQAYYTKENKQSVHEYKWHTKQHA